MTHHTREQEAYEASQRTQKNESRYGWEFDPWTTTTLLLAAYGAIRLLLDLGDLIFGN